MNLASVFSHSAQAVRKPIARTRARTRTRTQSLDWAGWSRDLLGLTGLAVWVVAWIGLMLYI